MSQKINDVLQVLGGLLLGFLGSISVALAFLYSAPSLVKLVSGNPNDNTTIFRLHLIQWSALFAVVCIFLVGWYIKRKGFKLLFRSTIIGLLLFAGFVCFSVLPDLGIYKITNANSWLPGIQK